MSNIDRRRLAIIIQEELRKALGEDALVSLDSKQKDDYRKSANYDTDFYQKCSQCGHGIAFEGETCNECGYNENTTNDIALIESDCGCGTCDGCDDNTILIKGQKKDHKGAYMAKSQLYKIAKYAEKLYYSIPHGHNLEDWMRSKLSQISDDISEVYHAIDHDKFEGDI